jgi:hypothetical protein
MASWAEAVEVDQPVEARGRVVTFWHEIEVAGEGEYPQVGRLLRRLHALPIPAGLELALGVAEP